MEEKPTALSYTSQQNFRFFFLAGNFKSKYRLLTRKHFRLLCCVYSRSQVTNFPSPPLSLSLSVPGFFSPFIKQRLANSKAHTSRFISANLPCNKFKNRLVNIMPFESTRVCLQPIRGVEGSDYINASCIDGYRSVKDFRIRAECKDCIKYKVLTLNFKRQGGIVLYLSHYQQTRSKPAMH